MNILPSHRAFDSSAQVALSWCFEHGSHLGTGFGVESPDNYKNQDTYQEKNGDYNAILVGNILYSQDTARSCSHPNYEL